MVIMLTKEILVDIITLYRQGKSMRTIARELNISRSTVKKYIVEPDAYPQYKVRLTTQSKLTPYKQYILQRIEAAKPHWMPACVHFQEIKNQGYPGEITLVRDYVAQFKAHNNKPVIRFEAKRVYIDNRQQLDVLIVATTKVVTMSLYGSKST